MINRVIWPRGTDPWLHRALNGLVEDLRNNTNRAEQLGVYADNDAALADKLTVGTMYRTATGEVKVVY